MYRLTDVNARYIRKMNIEAQACRFCHDLTNREVELRTAKREAENLVEELHDECLENYELMKESMRHRNDYLSSHRSHTRSNTPPAHGRSQSCSPVEKADN